MLPRSVGWGRQSSEILVAPRSPPRVHGQPRRLQQVGIRRWRSSFWTFWHCVCFHLTSDLLLLSTEIHPPCKPNWSSLSLHNTYLSRTSLDLKFDNCQAWFIPETGGLCFFSPLYLLRKETITFYKCIIFLSSPVPDPQVSCDLIN